ncbi:MAG: preprotein translocase subunit SecA [Muribaculaceae bacterium]|nr:preprotein translocase subunit SecA [Muribaculaceae bacterium]
MSLASILSKFFGNKSQRDLKEIQPIVDKINAMEGWLKELSVDQLRERIDIVRVDIAASIKADEDAVAQIKEEIETLPFDQRQPLWDKIDKHEKNIIDTLEVKLNNHLPEVFAVMRETASRFANNETIVVKATDLDRELAGKGCDFVSIDENGNAVWRNQWMAGGNLIKWDMKHYDVQLIGGIVLHQGKIAEMATGEGKTLVATLPVFLRSLSHRGVHVVTVNDYLSKRDSEWMGPLYMFHGSTVDCIDKHQPNTPQRRAAYNCDITFGTNNEFGFDYLRDNMALSPADLVQRKHYYAIVDEVDSVLIDDARTPLIISGPVPKGEDQMFDLFKSNVEKVVASQRKLVNQLLTEAKDKLKSEDKNVQKEGALALFRAFKGLPKYGALIKFLSQEGMKKILLDTEAYYLQDNAREMPKATEPLYFVIDEKNRSVDLTDKGIDELTGKSNDPQFFVLPDIASLLSELEEVEDLQVRQEKKDEVMNDYAIKSERVHTVNQLLKAYTLFDKDIEYVIDEGKIKIVDEQTGRIMEGRRYSDGLHQAIEAKEGVKVEAATQTFATITLQNYFRMYHKLAGMTGTAETEAGELWDIYKLDVVTIPTNRPIARIDMNDRVYRTKKEKYAAVIDEIVKLREAGRPVLVGTTSVEISELLKRMLDLRKIECQVLNAKLHQREAQVVALAGQSGTVTIATNMAGRGTDIKLSDHVKAAGGLAIIGTERHESRRVDRQLRGRSGRQGDPGSSVFFVSFEDQLMRLFATDRVMKMLDRLGLHDGEMIESKMVTNAIEKAQKRVEENNFGIRKRLLEYDDVMNKQRTYIYARRHHALLGERVGIDIANMLYDTIENIVNNYPEADYFEDMKLELMRVLTIEPPFTEEEFRNMEREDAINALYEAATQALDRKSERIIEMATPVIKDWVENRNAKGLIIVPITDGKRVYQIRVDINKAYDTDCRQIVKEWQKTILLICIDELWKEHLRELDQLRQSVQNASYEQKDPLVIYKVESFHIFERMLSVLNNKAMSSLLRGQLYIQKQEASENNPEQGRRAPEVRQAMPERSNANSNMKATKDELPGQSEQRAAMNASHPQRTRPEPIKVGPKVGRNDPCPCGSGKKFKNCHGRNDA